MNINLNTLKKEVEELAESLNININVQTKDGIIGFSMNGKEKEGINIIKEFIALKTKGHMSIRYGGATEGKSIKEMIEKVIGKGKKETLKEIKKQVDTKDEILKMLGLKEGKEETLISLIDTFIEGSIKYMKETNFLEAEKETVLYRGLKLLVDNEDIEEIKKIMLEALTMMRSDIFVSDKISEQFAVANIIMSSVSIGLSARK